MTKAKKNQTLFAIFRKSKVNFSKLPYWTQLQNPRDYGVLSRCSAQMRWALEEIREALILMDSPAFAHMKLDHVPGGNGESERQVALYARFKGWAVMMNEAGLSKHRIAAEEYVKGFKPYEIDATLKQRNGKAKSQIIRALEEYTKMFDNRG